MSHESHDHHELQSEKAAMRVEVRRRLAELTAEQKHAQSNATCERLMKLEAFRHAGTIMLYMPLPNEVDVLPLAIRSFQTGKIVCVPKVNWERRDMQPVEVTSFNDEELHTDERGLRFPADCRPIMLEQLDLVIVPGLAFDPTGRRLGRGGGFYDRFLTRVNRRIAMVGLAFDQQIVDAVPTGEHDIILDAIVTDRRVTSSKATGTRLP